MAQQPTHPLVEEWLADTSFVPPTRPTPSRSSTTSTPGAGPTTPRSPRCVAVTCGPTSNTAAPPPCWTERPPGARPPAAADVAPVAGVLPVGGHPRRRRRRRRARRRPDGRDQGPQGVGQADDQTGRPRSTCAPSSGLRQRRAGAAQRGDGQPDVPLRAACRRAAAGSTSPTCNAEPDGRMVLAVPVTKSDEPRLVPVHAETVRYLDRYLRDGRHGRGPLPGPLFLGATNRTDASTAGCRPRRSPR